MFSKRVTLIFSLGLLLSSAMGGVSNAESFLFVDRIEVVGTSGNWILESQSFTPGTLTALPKLTVLETVTDAGPFQFKVFLNTSIDTDSDGDGVDDRDDVDDDNDGIADVDDKDASGNDQSKDTDNDGIVNSQDGDIDGDGILNGSDSDPFVRDDSGFEDGRSPNLTDSDDDGITDDIDDDDDNDGKKDVDDKDASGNDRSKDTDNDGIANKDDDDIDGDGILNDQDKRDFDTDNDGVNNDNDIDDDNDGFADIDDDAPLNPNIRKDTDGDGIDDRDDPDADGDGILDNFQISVDKNLTNATGSPIVGIDVSLGTGLGSNFVLSAPGDSFYFLDNPPPMETSGAFGAPQATPSTRPDLLVFSGNLGLGLTANLWMGVNIPKAFFTGGVAMFSVQQAVTLGPNISVVPEPSSLVLFGLGFAGLAAFSLRRRRRARS